MKIDAIVSTWEQGKHLQTLGIKPMAIFFHVLNMKCWEIVSAKELKEVGDDLYVSRDHEEYLVQEIYPAWTVGELLIMRNAPAVEITFPGEAARYVANNLIRAIMADKIKVLDINKRIALS